MMNSVVLLSMVLVGSAARQDKIDRSFQLMEKEKVQECRGLLPKTSDPVLLGIYKKDLLFYSDQEIPPMFQHSGNTLHTKLNISANRSEKTGNANEEFPWKTPAGLHLSPTNSFKKFNFIYLPSPVVYWQETMRTVVTRSVPEGRPLESRPERNLRWSFPNETVVGEVLLVKNPNEDKFYAFDLRTRTKIDGKWNMQAYRPFRTYEQMDRWLRENAKEEVNIDKFREKTRVVVQRLTDEKEHPNDVVFDRTAAIQILPALPESIVKRALAKNFVATREAVWTRSEDGTEGFAPTTQEDFHIIPKGYQGAYLRVSNGSCMTCHEGSFLKEAGDFTSLNRDWYGRVKGTGPDGIFSFHPVAKDAVSWRYTLSPPPYKVNEGLLKAGLIKQWKESDN